MVISDEHRYVFIEVPLTGSNSVHLALVTHYGGHSILHRHASYPDFRRVATPEQRRYFTFAAVRNPLDELVSRYTKLRHDPRGALAAAAADPLTVDPVDARRHQLVAGGLTFEQYLARRRRRPFGGMIELSRSHLDAVLRFETLERDFCDVLRHLGLAPRAPLPFINRTGFRQADWQAYYPPALRPQAQRCCAVYMERWGYEFPADWEKTAISLRERIAYSCWQALRRVYFTHVRYHQGAIADAARRVASALLVR